MITREDIRLIKEFSGLSYEAFGRELGYKGMYIKQVEIGSLYISQEFEKRIIAWLKSEKTGKRLKHLMELRGK